MPNDNISKYAAALLEASSYVVDVFDYVACHCYARRPGIMERRAMNEASRLLDVAFANWEDHRGTGDEEMLSVFRVNERKLHLLNEFITTMDHK